MSTPVSPEAISHAPAANPTTIAEFEKLLAWEQSKISEADFTIISKKLSDAKAMLATMASGNEKYPEASANYLATVLKEQTASLESAKRNREAELSKQRTGELQSAAKSAAKAGDPRAATALRVVAAETAPIKQKMETEAQAIKSQVPPKSEELKVSVSETEAMVISLRARFDDRINFNDALDILLRNKASFDKISTNDAYLNDTTKESPLTKLLDANGYLAKNRFGSGDNNYTTQELVAILELREALKDEKISKNLTARTRIQRSVAISEKPSTDGKQMLARLLDFNRDGTLTSFNEKERSSNVLVAGLQRMFGLGKDTQLRVAPELMAYQALSPQIKSEKDIYALIANKTGMTPADAEASWKDEKKRGPLIEAFQRAFILEVERSTTTVAAKIDASADIRNYQLEKAREQARQIQAIRDQLAQEGMVGTVQAKLTGAGLPQLDSNSMKTLLDQTAFRIYEINPQIFASFGVKGAVTEHVTNTTTHTTEINTDTVTTRTSTTDSHTIKTLIRQVDVVQAANGTPISRNVTEKDGGTSTSSNTSVTSADKVTVTQKDKGSVTTTEKRQETRIQPTLVIGLHQDVVGVKTERTNLQAGVGASAVAGVDGIIFPITASVSGNLTAANHNAALQSTKLEGNYVFGARLGMSTTVGGNGQVIPSLGFDFNPNDVANAIEKQEVRLEELLEKIQIDEKGQLNVTDLEKDLAALEAGANKKDPKDIGMLNEIALMRKFLKDTRTAIGGIPETDALARRVLIRNSMTDYKKAYREALLASNKGFHLAGMNVTFIPGITAVFLGLNIQNVSANAKKTGKDTTEAKLSQKELKIEDVPELKMGTNGSLVISTAALESGYITLRPGPTTKKSEDGVTTEAIPTKGNKLRFQQFESRTGEGIVATEIVIDQVPAEKTEKKEDYLPVLENADRTRIQNLLSEKDTDFIRVLDLIKTGKHSDASAALAMGGKKLEFIFQKLPTDAEKRKVFLDYILTIEAGKISDVYNGKAFDPTERTEIFNLSRSNRYLISATNAIMTGNYSGAKAALEKGGSKLKFIVDKMPKNNADIKPFLDNLLLVTSGSRGTREKSDMTYAQMVAEQKKSWSAFRKLLPIDGTRPGAYNEYDRIQSELNQSGNPTEKVALSPLSSIVGGGYRDIAGTVSFSQVGVLDGKRQRTLGGLFRFSGDMQVMAQAVSVDSPQMKAMILKTTEESGVFAKNLKQANEVLKSANLTELKDREYRTYLLYGVMPERYDGALDLTVKPKFLATRAALPGATCFNDVFVIAFPLVTVRGRTVETSIPVEDTTVTGSLVATGDAYAGNGGVGSGTVSVGLFEEVTNRVVNQAVDKVVRTASGHTDEVTKVNTTSSTVVREDSTITRLPEEPVNPVVTGPATQNGQTEFNGPVPTPVTVIPTGVGTNPITLDQPKITPTVTPGTTTPVNPATNRFGIN